MKSRGVELLADVKGWMPVASGEAKLALKPEPIAGGAGLRLEFDFKGGGGFVVARKKVRRAMPEAFAIRFSIRGQGPVNHLELKLVDATGKNVWRFQLKDFHLPARAKALVVTNREIEFAWGPAGGGVITALSAVEVAIVAGAGGAGRVWISELTIEDQSFAKCPILTVSSAGRGYGKTHVLDGRADTAWRPVASDALPWIVLDSLAPRVLGGLVVEWETEAPRKGFRVKGSNDGLTWRRLYGAVRAGGRRSFVYLPHTQVRYLRLELNEPAGVVALKVQPFEFSRSVDAFFHAVAALHPRGWFPRWLLREQSLWTPAGGLMGRTCALLNEQGMWEPDEGSFGIEPMVSVEGRLYTWADVVTTCGLMDGWMPAPWVSWEGEGWRLTVQLLAGGRQAQYRLENTSNHTLAMRLQVLLRPFQVTPPWQHFRNVGGVSDIRNLAWHEGVVWVNGQHAVTPLTPGAQFGAMNFEEGCVPELLAAGRMPRCENARAKAGPGFGAKSGVLAFDFSVQPGAMVEVRLEVARVEMETAGGRHPLDRGQIAVEGAERLVALEAERAFWLATLPCDQLNGSGWAQEVIQSQLTAAAQILVTQSGPALQPGPRRYTRSWIRDGTIMSAALLRMGRFREVRAFIRWYVPFQRADGFVPCCVDRDGVDWLVEHDSHGQLIALIRDDHRFTGDAVFLAEMWPAVCRAVSFIKGVREEDGLLPVSVSHEGYLAQPVHSFWDDFWALRGLRAAVQVAQVLGHADEAARWQALAESQAAAVFAAVEATRQTRSLSYIPASREWADFDPTATANALMLFDVPAELDTTALAWTFDKYLEDWRKKRTGALPWTNYTAYEIRIIGAFVRLRKRAEALELLKFFLSDRRPLPWNQWPEISWADPQSPGHVGDVPHTWIAAEYVLAVRCLFAYESDTLEALVLAAGVAPEWLENGGVTVQALRTYHGLLSYRLWSEGPGRIAFAIEGGLAVPAGGLVLRPPGRVRGATVNGKEVKVRKDEVVIRRLPAQGVIETEIG